jgi:tetratricopeptide (TPR) repeat protein
MGKHEEAIKNFQKAVNINPDNDAAYNNIGNAFSNLKQFEEAIKNFQKAVDINPDYDAAYYNMGNAFVNFKQFEEAIKSFQKAIEINPDNDWAYNSLGLTYLRADEIDNAFKAFHKGLEINPDNKYSNFSLLGAYVRINDQNKSKKLMINLINKVEKDLLTISLTEDVFYNLFRFGSDAFIKSYFDFLLKLMLKEKKESQLYKALPDSLFDILINIEDYDKERLNNIEKALTELLIEYQESIIPLKMFSIGVAYLKNKEKNAIFKLSKEERKLFKEAVLDKISRP